MSYRPTPDGRAERPRDHAEDGLPTGLGRPARRALAAAGYARLDQLAGVAEADALKLHGVGPNALGVLRRAIADRGRSFAPDMGGVAPAPASDRPSRREGEETE